MPSINYKKVQKKSSNSSPACQSLLHLYWINCIIISQIQCYILQFNDKNHFKFIDAFKSLRNITQLINSIIKLSSRVFLSLKLLLACNYVKSTSNSLSIILFVQQYEY